MDLIEIADRRIAEIEAELEELRTFKRTHQRLLEMSRSAADTTQQSVPIIRRRPVAVTMATVAEKSKRQQIEDAAASLLATQQPLGTQELLTRIAAMGIDVGGNDPMLNLATYLSRSGRFESRRRDGGWRPTSPSTLG